MKCKWHAFRILCGAAALFSAGTSVYGATRDRLVNQFIQAELNTADGRITVKDLRTGCRWEQIVPTASPVKSIKVIERSESALVSRLELTGGETFTLTLKIEPEAPELTVSLDGDQMPSRLDFPFPFYPEKDADSLLAIKSGLLMPVTDETIYFKGNTRHDYYYYEGHNASMPFNGLINKKGDGLMCLVETPNDAGFDLSRRDSRLLNQVFWKPQFGKAGYTRRLRYILFDNGGYVAMANRFRDYAQQEGMIKTLKEKAAKNPNVDKLVGAANLWLQDYDNVLPSCAPVAKEMVAMGMSRMIFQGKSSWWNNMSAADIKAVNALGYLSGRYDIYQDVFDTNRLDLVRVNPAWVPEAWPDEIVVNSDGSYYNGWDVEGFDGKKYFCHRVNELCRTKYARARISKELAAKPYLARLIDTEAASNWAEDYRPGRMMSRTQCRAGRMDVLNYVKYEANQVTGAEGLQCFAVPYVDYFEGVGPIEPFRPADLTGNIFRNFDPGFEFPPEFSAMLKVSHRYLVPLWDLVFHDCVIVYPRWEVGVRNKYPVPLWVDKGILQDVLYGRPPLFTIDPEEWAKEEHRQRIKKIYDAECPVARKVGYARMLSHEVLDKKRDVQRTIFDNGTVITVNFGETEYNDDRCGILQPWSYHLADSPAEKAR